MFGGASLFEVVKKLMRNCEARLDIQTAVASLIENMITFGALKN